MFVDSTVTSPGAPESRSEHSPHGTVQGSSLLNGNKGSVGEGDARNAIEDTLQHVDVPAAKQHTTRDVTLHWLMKFHPPQRAAPIGGRSLLSPTPASTSHIFLSGCDLEHLCDEAIQRNAGGLLYRSQQRASPWASSSEQLSPAQERSTSTPNPYASSPLVPLTHPQLSHPQPSSSSRPTSAALSGRAAAAVTIAHTERNVANVAAPTAFASWRQPRPPSSPRPRMLEPKPRRRAGHHSSPGEYVEDDRIYDRLSSVEKSLLHCGVVPDAFALRCTRAVLGVGAARGFHTWEPTHCTAVPRIRSGSSSNPHGEASSFHREVHPAVAVMLVVQRFIRAALSMAVVARKRRERLAARHAWSRDPRLRRRVSATAPRSPAPPLAPSASTRHPSSDATLQQLLSGLQTPLTRRHLERTSSQKNHAVAPPPVALTINAGGKPPRSAVTSPFAVDRTLRRVSGSVPDHDEGKFTSSFLAASNPISGACGDTLNPSSTPRRLSVSKATEVSRARRLSHHEETIHVSVVLEEAAFSLHKFFVLAAHRWKARVVACRARAYTDSRVQTEQLEIVQSFLRGKQARATYYLRRNAWVRNRAACVIQARLRGFLARLWYWEHHQNLMLWLDGRVQREMEVTAATRVLDSLRRFKAVREVKKRQQLVFLKLLYREENERRQQVQDLLASLQRVLGALATRMRRRHLARQYNDHRIAQERQEDRISQQPVAAKMISAFWAARRSRVLCTERMWMATEIASREMLQQTYLASDSVSRILAVGAHRHAHEVILRFFSLAAARWKRSRHSTIAMQKTNMSSSMS